MQQGIKNLAGVIGGAQVRGLARDQPEPKSGGNPCLQLLAVGGGQADLPERRNRRPIRPLFHGIVRSFTSNHHIMDMALAQASAADADEARLLQKLRDCGTAAITHAGL